MTGRRDTRDDRFAVWGILIDMDERGEIPDGRNPLDGGRPTGALIDLVAKRAGVARSSVREWLHAADLWTPYQDREVVWRARNFDVDAWDSATNDERASVMNLWLELIAPGETPGEYAARAGGDADAGWNHLEFSERKRITDRIDAARRRRKSEGA